MSKDEDLHDDYEDYEDYDDDVEIQGPAMKEIRRTRSCIRRTCFSGCGCFFVLALIIVAGFWLFAPPLPKETNVVPDDFPTDLPVYKIKSATKIEYISAKRQKRGPETAAFIPKILLAPVFLALEEPEEHATSTVGAEAGKSAWHAFRGIVKEPLKDYRNLAIINWKGLSAEPQFIDDWYQAQFVNAGLRVQRDFLETTIRKITFDDDGIDGTVVIEEGLSGTTKDVTLTVEYTE